MLTFRDLLLSGPEALCLTDSDMIIIQHNQNMNLLLGNTDMDLRGKNLSSIFFDDLVIKRFLAKNNQEQWYQGECIIKTSSELPLIVKFRAARVIEGIGEKWVNAFLFREIEEFQRNILSRRITALNSMLNSAIDMNKTPKSILSDFAKAYDENSEAFLLGLDLDNENLSEKDRELLSSKQIILASQIAINNRVPTIFHSEKSLCFFPIYSEKATYGVCYIKLSMNRFYEDEDKYLFNLCGRIMGSRMENPGMLGNNEILDSLFHVVFNCMKQPIVVVNPQGLTTMINNSAKAVYGFAETEMLGRSFGDIAFPMESAINYESLIGAIMKGDFINDLDMTHIRSDFTVMEVRVSIYPFKYNGKILGAVFIIQEMEGQKRLNDKLIQWERLSVLGELLHSAANELNNSLTSVIGHSEMLSQLENNDKVYDISSKIYKGALRCGNVVKGLIDLARNDDPRKGYSSIEEVLGSALDLKRYQLRSNNIELHINLGENVPRIAADLHDLERLFLHIINYAEKRMLQYNNGGKLHIETGVFEPHVVIHFADTGACIYHDYDIDDIISCLSEKSLDADIDLIASCQIIKKINGLMEIDSQIGKGNIVTLKLPTIGSMPAELSRNDYEMSIQNDKSGKRILLVDDEVDIVDLLTDFLEEKNYIVDIARDGNEAIEKVFRNNYDLIVSDLKMPNGFTGSKLHGFIKRENPDMAKRVIFMTGDIINSETQKFLHGTGNPYLEKPFLPESLMEIIRQIDTR